MKTYTYIIRIGDRVGHFTSLDAAKAFCEAYFAKTGIVLGIDLCDLGGRK